MSVRGDIEMLYETLFLIFWLYIPHRLYAALNTYGTKCPFYFVIVTPLIRVRKLGVCWHLNHTARLGKTGSVVQGH